MLEFRLIPTDPIERARFDADLDLLEGEWVITARQARTRTSPQNRFYHGVVCRYFAEYMRRQGEPWTTKRCHETLATLHLRVSENIGGVLVERVRSTTELSVEEMSEYIENCIVWLWDRLNVTVPSPNDLNADAA